jgi:N-acylneuraminate cytidylyltransferase
MRIIGLIPIKAENKRVPGKNFRLLNGRPLFHYIVEAACNAGLSQVYLNTDSEIAKNYARQLGIEVIDRPAWLSVDSANGNHLLVQISPTCLR